MQYKELVFIEAYPFVWKPMLMGFHLPLAIWMAPHSSPFEYKWDSHSSHLMLLNQSTCIFKLVRFVWCIHKVTSTGNVLTNMFNPIRIALIETLIWLKLSFSNLNESQTNERDSTYLSTLMEQVHSTPKHVWIQFESNSNLQYRTWINDSNYAKRNITVYE